MPKRLSILIYLSLTTGALAALFLFQARPTSEQIQAKSTLIWQSPASRPQKLRVFGRPATVEEVKKAEEVSRERLKREQEEFEHEGGKGIVQATPVSSYYIYNFVLDSPDGNPPNLLWRMTRGYCNGIIRDKTEKIKFLDVAYDVQGQNLVCIYSWDGNLISRFVSLAHKDKDGQQKVSYEEFLRDDEDTGITITSAQLQGAIRKNNLSVAVCTKQKQTFKYLWKKNKWVEMIVS